MKFFADTADISEIEEGFLRGVDDGITTNPKIIETTGNLSSGFEGACKSLVDRYPSVPISLETDLEGMSIKEMHNNPLMVKEILLRQSEALYTLGDNVVIKIPICEGGLLATEELTEKNIKTNVTACMSPYQALMAAENKATYVSLFANRMLDSHILELGGNNLETILEERSWKETLNNSKKDKKILKAAWDLTLSQIAYVAEKLDKEKSDLIVGSIRSVEDMYKLASAGPQVITIPTKIMKNLKDIQKLKNTKRTIKHTGDVKLGSSLIHPMTNYSIAEFERAAKTYRQ